LTIAEDIAAHAARRPSAIAIVNAGQEISYAQLARDLGKFTAALRDFRLRPGSLVAVACGDRYFDWLLLLAFEQLGHATASISTSEGQECWPFLAGMDLILSEQPFPGLPTRQHLITREWLEDVARAGGEAEVTTGAADHPGRILRTSGTSGGAKRIILSRRMHELKYARWASVARVSDRSRFLLTMSFAVGSSYMCAMACLSAGATIVTEGFEGPFGFARVLKRHAITHVGLLPMHLNAVLEALPPGAVPAPGPAIFTFGAAVTPALGQKAVERLGGEVCDIYGANEAGLISYRYPTRDDAFGTIGPGVEIEVVDDRDTPLPEGEIGQIRLKTDCMVHGYADDPAATAAMFREGWFYPGDMGIIHGGSRLRVIGRSDDLLNIGGAKLSPAALEELVLKHAAVRDAGVCTIKNQDGIDELCVAIAGIGTSDDELMRRIGEAFRTVELGNFHVAKLDQIPRNPNGKIQRDMLKATFAAARGR
jgi:acyl-coenzyme A synthetase/AMP-(fatty) acid ligase